MHVPIGLEHDARAFRIVEGDLPLFKVNLIAAIRYAKNYRLGRGTIRREGIDLRALFRVVRKAKRKHALHALALLLP